MAREAGAIPADSGRAGRLRAWGDARLARLREDGFRGLISIAAATRVRLVKATLAATLAWEAADLLSSPRPALASLAAILVVQVTVRATLARSIQLTVGVTIGLIIAVSLGHLLGQHWWTIGLIVLGGLATGELLRLGPFAAQTAISALLAFSLGGNYGLARIEDTIVGAVIGVVVNALVAPPSVAAETAAKLRREAEDLGLLLADIGHGLPDGLHADQVARWLERARACAAGVGAAVDDLDQVEESLRFNPLGRTTDEHVARLVESGRALEHVAVQARGIARALGDLARDRAVSGPADAVLRLIGAALIDVGHATSAFGRLQEDPESAPDRAQATAAVASAVAHREAAAAATAEPGAHARPTPPDALLLSSILVDTSHLIREVDVEHGTHVAAVTVTRAS